MITHAQFNPICPQMFKPFSNILNFLFFPTLLKFSLISHPSLNCKTYTLNNSDFDGPFPCLCFCCASYCFFLLKFLGIFFALVSIFLINIVHLFFQFFCASFLFSFLWIFSFSVLLCFIFILDSNIKQSEALSAAISKTSLS